MYSFLNSYCHLSECFERLTRCLVNLIDPSSKFVRGHSFIALGGGSLISLTVELTEGSQS
jgi:hypothetical protein